MDHWQNVLCQDSVRLGAPGMTTVYDEDPGSVARRQWKPPIVADFVAFLLANRSAIEEPDTFRY